MEIINTHYLFNQVEEYAKSSKYKDEIQLVYEPELLGTAATIKANYNFLAGSDCFLIHADNYCLTDFNQFINAHNQRPLNCVMTMMSFQTETPETCGVLEIDKNGIVIGFHEKVKNPPGNLANGAVYILSSELIEWINLRNITDFSTQVIPFWLGKIANFENKNIHIDIGSVESYNRAQQIGI